MISNDPNFWYQSMYFDAEMERIFVRDYLGPTLRASSITKSIPRFPKEILDLNILILDHNRDLIPDFPFTILRDNLAASYVARTAVHFYADDTVTSDVLSHVL